MTTETVSYHLKSDLARVCLARPTANPERVIAWLNSICFLFLLVAISGVRPHLPPPKRVPALEQPVALIVQPLPPAPPKQIVAHQKEEPAQAASAAAQVVITVPNTPAINFSVPTIGNVISPNAIAVPPPVAVLSAPAPAPARTGPKNIGSTGEGGDRPQPPYPEMALKFGQQGTVVLLLTADESGIVRSVSVRETSGSLILDRSAVEFVKRRWIVPPGGPGRLFLATISYQIATN